ncbi:MAG: lamin tail domain-containing protein, partial [Verrucomicrobiota bacterium]
MRGQLKAKKILAIGGALVGWLIGATPIDARDSVVVFNEVHYHPSGDEATEWIELHNQMAVDVDVSHWRLRGGVRFDFPADTVIAGGGFLVIAADPASLNGVEGGVYGPFEGALDNGGETLRLEDRSTLGTVPGGKARHRVMDELSYEDGDLWPIGADGSGATLAKIDPDGGTALVANWAASSQVGGTPGEANFPDGRRELSGLSFNEVDSAVADPFQLELKSSDGTDLSELCLRSSNPERLETTLEGILPAGGIGVVSENQLGYRPVEGERLFLIGKEGGELVDAIVVEEQPQGRDSAGLWRFEEIRTFGSENQIEIADSVVINEIMYRARPLHATAAIPGEFESTDLVDAGATWRFHSHGGAVPENWTTGLADWEIGRMPFGSGIDQAQPPLQTFLGLRSADNGYVGAFYFYQVFQVEADPALFHDLALRLWFDDGVAVYLNGTEIHRENLPEGMLTEKTSALDELDQPQWQDLEGISAGLLQEGVNVLAVEVHQKFTLFKQSEDVAFGAELAGRTAIKEPIPATSHRESETEWVELFNGGEESVDLVGWSLEDGARYEFPAGTTLPAGGYVVVDDLKGTLSNGGERLALIDAGGNTVDEVMYHDRGRWPREADGYGASLELRDPDADNRWAAAWAASDERGASEWQHYSYEGVAEEDGIGTQLYHELVVGMLDAGELLLDDVQVIEDPEGAAVEFMQNGDFEKGTVGGAPDHWLIVGTHGQSHLVEDPDEPGNQVLKVVTTGPTEDKHNQMSSVYAANRRVRIGETYRISFRAKWLSGSSLLNTRLYFNFLQRTTRVAMPETGGTPGRQNSAFENSGPIMDGLTQHPVLPVAEQEVEVRIQVTDADGIESVKLTYAVNGGSIFSGGTHVVDMEGEGSGPWYRGTIPGRKTGDLIRFFVTATDRMGRTAEFPPAGKDSRALYEVVEEASVGDPGVRPHRFRVLMEKMDREFLFEDVNHMSNDRISGTVIYKDIAYHNVGIRLKGSAWARNNTPFQGLNIRFDPEHPFRGVHETVALERDPGKGEILAHHLFYAAGGLLPSIYSDVVDLEFEQSSFSGRVLLLMARTSSPFLGGTFNNASEGTVYNLELLYTPQATVDRQPESLKRHFPYTHDKGRYDFRRMGPDKESYRWGFQIRSQRNRDHYEPLVRMAEALDLEGVRLAEAATQAMDVDQWARAFAMMALNGNDDFYTRLWEHNLRLYHRPEDDRMVALPWDFDRAWRLATSSPLIGGTNNAGAMVNLPKVLNRPENKRLFYGHLHDMLESVYNPEY